MAIIMSKQSGVSVVKNILAGYSQGLAKVDYLIQHGAEVLVGLLSITITIKGKVLKMDSPAVLSLYDSQDYKIKSIIRQKVLALIEDALQASALPTPPTNPEIPAVDAPSPTPQAITPAPIAKPAPTASIIKLKDARALSQQVSGTSGGSIYRAAAIGKVNIAIREQASTVSIRAEFQDSKDSSIAAKLVSLGFTENASYLSMHVTLSNGAPAMRVVGSILLGAGIEFEQIATTRDQILGTDVAVS